MAAIKCDHCGRFCSHDDIIGVGDDNEEWTECVRCTSDSELKFHGKVRK